MRRGRSDIEWEGRPVLARDGEAIGSVLRVHGVEDSGWPEYVVVDLGAHNLALPATGAVLTRDELRLPWPARRLREARPLDAEAHDDPAAVGRAAAAFEEPTRVALAEDPDAMTLSEEQLDVTLEAVPTERVALRKTIVSDTVSVPVTVRREVVEIVREPVPAPGEEPTADTVALPETPDGEPPAGAVAADAPTAVTMALPETPAEVAEGVAAEVVLYEERPVVGVEIVPRERIRLVKRFEVDEVAIAGEVRREEAAVDRLPPEPAA